MYLVKTERSIIIQYVINETDGRSNTPHYTVSRVILVFRSPLNLEYENSIQKKIISNLGCSIFAVVR